MQRFFAMLFMFFVLDVYMIFSVLAERLFIDKWFYLVFTIRDIACPKLFGHAIGFGCRKQTKKKDCLIQKK